MTPQENLELIRKAVEELKPNRVAIEVETLTSSRVQAWAAKEASARSSDEPPMPTRDAYDRYLEHRARMYAEHLDRALGHLTLAVHHQHEVLLTVTLEEAQAMIEAESGDDLEACAHCGVMVNKSKGERIVAGRCFACYEYRRRHDGKDAPQAVLDARIEQ